MMVNIRAANTSDKGKKHGVARAPAGIEILGLAHLGIWKKYAKTEKTSPEEAGLNNSRV